MSKEEHSELHQIIADQSAQGVKLDTLNETCGRIEECLLGNGRVGLVVRTDRLEQKDKMKSKFFWLLFSSVVIMAVKVLADTLGYSLSEN